MTGPRSGGAERGQADPARRPVDELVATIGVIGDMSIPLLFQGLLADKKTGTVVFMREPVVKKVYVAGGEVFFASSNLSEDRLVEWLCRAGTISRQQCDTAAEMVKTTGKKSGTVLQELGYLSAEKLAAGLRYQVRQIFVSLFNWRTGSYLIDEDTALHFDSDTLMMNTRDLIIDGLREMEWSVVRKSLPPLGTILRSSAEQSLPPQGEALEQDHRTILSFIDGRASIEEICARSGIGDFNALKAVYALLALRLAVKGDLKKEGAAGPVRVEASTVVETNERRTTEPASSAVLTTEMLLEAHKRLARQNLYEVLDVGRAATAQEIKKAYFTLAKRYHPDRHFGPSLNEMKGHLETLFNAIHEAYETLADPDRRDQYDRALADNARQPQVKTAAGTGNHVKASAARAHFAEGMKYFDGRNYWDAEESFEWAERFDPSNAEYVFRRAMALSHMPRRGRDSEEYFAKALKMAPSSIGYYLEFANFYVRHGLKAKAMSVYQEALKQNPNAEKIKEAIQKTGG